MESDDRAAVLIPLGDFLTAEEPVWVWDVEARRILWANQAGCSFWGAPSVDALRARRFSAQDKAAARIAALMRAPSGASEWTETLALASASGRTTVTCYMQILQIAGGRTGLIVKALSTADGSGDGAAKPKARRSRADKRTASPADQTALKAIAAQMESAVRPASKKSAPAPKKPVAVAPAAKKPAAPALKTPTPAVAPAAKKAAAPAPKKPVAVAPAAKKAAAPATPPRKSVPRSSALNPLGDEPYHMPDALTLMLRELCHELRNPLTVILGFSERIRDSGLIRRNPEKAQSYAGNIMESAELAMEILADFSARVLRPGASLPQPDPVEIGPIVARCLQLITPLATQAGLKVSKTAGKTLPRLHISERALKQILLNVLMNAVRHQKTGGKVHMAARKLKDGSVRLTVSDDGIGMTKKEIRTALEFGAPVIAPDPSTGRSGLGLPLVKKLVESTGGTLRIDSVRHKGTTIEILFPATATVEAGTA